MLSEAEFHESLRQERRQSLAAGRAFAEACRRSDLQAFHETVNFINEATCDGWRHAMRWAARLDQRVDEAISEAFLKAWIENKSIADNFESSSMLIPALRNLLPAYTGLGLRLYRGGSAREVRRRRYGLSWSTHIHVAEKFAADGRQCSEGGSCVVETDAPCTAIIGSTELAGDYYNEGEYLVDRRLLGSIRVTRRFSQIGGDEFRRAMREQMAPGDGG